MLGSDSCKQRLSPLVIKVDHRLSLVPVSIAHAVELSELVQQNYAHLHAYLPAVANLVTVTAASEHLTRAVEAAANREIFEWHVFIDERLCGCIRVKQLDFQDRKAMLGYYLGGDFQGRGIASSAVRAVLSYCFETLELNRIELRAAASNVASIALAKRVGFAFEGVARQDEFLNGRYVDLHVYSMLALEFERETSSASVA